MPEHLASVSEIKELGILLKAGREHDIRVLGAFRKKVSKPLPASKEEIAEALAGDASKKYVEGKIQGTQEDPEQSPFFPRTPSLYVSRDDAADFLKRDLT